MRAVLVIYLAALLTSQAEPPRKESISKYTRLWTASLVTVPPPPPEQAVVEETTPLDDYVLGGYTKMKSGYFVSLINKTDPKQRLTIATGAPGSSEYSVLQVQSNPDNFTDVKLLIKVGAQQKWIGYDDKFLTLSRPATPKAGGKKPPNPAAALRNAQKQGRSNAQRNQQANQQGNTNNKRKPRVRRVPVPPTSK